ncbi:hypothetical protein [Tunturiibacter lichenicola]|uniref:hypothetical protein n=1 Tax=Tunturiibacter lichenicola TaxID=2051959 RepID=UPI0021B3C9E3|nr:hypothetical protein [Edaphobacter lichenicola]
MTDQPKTSKWSVTLNGGEWGTVKYGIVEYLRTRPKMRATTAVTGLLWMAGWIASMAGYKWHFLLFPAVSTIFVTPTLLWLAVVSGPDFRLTFAEPKTPDPPSVSSAEVKGVLDVEGYGLEALNKSYIFTEAYGRSGFRWSMCALIAGIAVACGNVWLVSSGAATTSFVHASPFIWIFAATLFLLCVILLVRSMLIFRRSTVIHDRLLELQKTITAVKYLERSKETPALIDPSLVFAKLLSSSANSDGSK